MESLLELLLPAIVLILFVLGKLFGSRDEEEDVPPPGRQVRPGPPVETDDRTRQIQEEIRRKIAERRAAQEGGAPPPVPQQPVARQMPPPVPAAPLQEETPRRGLSRYEDVADNRWDQQQAPEMEAPVQPEFATPPSPVAAFQAQLEQQRQRAEEARQRLEQARLERTQQEREGRFRKTARSWGRTPAETGETVAQSVQRMLQNPNATQQAFLLYEILGTPVGLRSPDGGQRPKWEE